MCMCSCMVTRNMEIFHLSIPWLLDNGLYTDRNIPIRASINKSLLYTTGGEVSAEFYGLPQINPYIILLNVGYPMNFYCRKSRNAFGFNYLFKSLHIHFKTVLSLRTGLLQTVSFLSQM